jgi:cytochrome oxidase assembly protein ShyY1
MIHTRVLFKVVIRNEHMQYIATWFTLSAATLVMWIVRVRPQLLRRVPK